MRSFCKKAKNFARTVRENPCFKQSFLVDKGTISSALYFALPIRTFPLFLYHSVHDSFREMMAK